MMLVIYGPTAIGKTSLAINLATKLNGEIISVDSRQVYTGLDIGSGKVNFDTKTEKHHGFWIVDGIKINGFDLQTPGTNFSVADFINFANAALFRITEAKKMPIIAGGTGFYLKALLVGLDTFGIEKNQKLRSELEKLSKVELLQKLKSLNSSKVNSMNVSDRQNPRRLVRAIEIEMSQKRPSTRNQLAVNPIKPEQSKETSCQVIGLKAPNKFLFRRADQWLENRLKHGLEEEVKSLLNEVDSKWLDDLGLEYRWIKRELTGETERDQAISRLKGDIHSFIRRQKTWFGQFPNLKLYDISEANWQSRLENDILKK